MNQISDFKASSLILHGCSATQFNVLRSISVILPILCLHSGGLKHLGRLQKFCRLCSCSAFGLKALRSISVLLPIRFLLSVWSLRNFLMPEIKPIALKLSEPRIIVHQLIRRIRVLLHCNYCQLPSAWILS